MKKLVVIPIYCLTPINLNLRVKRYVSELQEMFKDIDEEIATTAINAEIFPVRNFEYNHIVGCIRVSISKTDMLFDIFLPNPIPKRYVWKTTRKILVQNIQANGTHFYLGNLHTNEEISCKATMMLNQIISDHIPNRFYVDVESFLIINANLDYLKIIQELR